MYFSADTCYDPELIRKMHKEGALRDGRAEWWLNFSWHHNLILHEAGVPPIHTPVSILASLPEDVKKRLYLVHTSTKAIPPGSNLKIAPEGVENSLVLDVTPHVHSEAIELLKVVDSIDMFHVFSLAQARELLQNAIPLHYTAGTTIIKKGTDGSDFFIVEAGIVCISDSNWSKNLVSGDYFGEMSLVTGNARTATAEAITDVDLICFRKEDFLSILRGNQETVDFILNLSKRRQEPSWQIISANTILSRMTNAQKTKLQAILEKKIVKKGEFVWKAGSNASYVYLVGSGEVKFEGKEDLTPFKNGAFIGETNSILADSVHTTTVVAVTDGWGYIIQAEELKHFLHKNPGIKLSFLDTNFIDRTKEEEAQHVCVDDGCMF